MKTLVLGASDKPDRYSYKAMLMLESHGHEVVLVHPTLKSIGTRPVISDLQMVKDSIDTVTVYLNPSTSDSLETALKTLHPRRVIFNPGAENPRLARGLRAVGIETEDACTLVLLRSGQF